MKAATHALDPLLRRTRAVCCGYHREANNPAIGTCQSGVSTTLLPISRVSAVTGEQNQTPHFGIGGGQKHIVSPAELEKGIELPALLDEQNLPAVPTLAASNTLLYFLQFCVYYEPGGLRPYRGAEQV